ncbi:MAG: hypothetical protein NTY23_15730 [Chloroflexi bacterium]|nr:hypothetical protein [Chloroflexota bacterium]
MDNAQRDLTAPVRLSLGLAATMVAQSALGLALHAEYRDAAWIRATWLGNDALTLALAVPMLLGGLALARRGSTRGVLLWLGMLAYGVYNYAYYLFGAALNVFLPLYVLPLVLSVVTLILTLSRTDATALAGQFRPRTPVRLLGGYFVFVAAGLACVWLGMWAAYVFAGRPTPVESEAFKLVAALDLSLMVNSGIQILQGNVAAPGEIPVWGTLALFTTAATGVLVANVDAP